MRVSWNLLTARQNRFDRTEGDRRDAPFVSIDLTGDDFIDDFGELFDLRVTFGFAHFLNNDLFGRLSTDAADNFFVVQQLLAMTTSNFTRLAFDEELDVSLITEVPSRSGHQCRFDQFKDRLLLNVFFSM